MSNGDIRKVLAEELKKRLSGEANSQIRKSLQEASRPQAIDLENLDFIKDTTNSISGMPKFEATQEDLAIARAKAKEYQDSFRTSNPQIYAIALAKLNKDRKDIATDLRKGIAFLVRNFYEADKLKKDIIASVLENKKLYGDKRIAQIISSSDRGHGGDKGLAVATLSIASASELLGKAGILENKNFSKALETYLKQEFRLFNIDLANVEIVKQVIVNYSQTIKNGEVISEYVPTILYQDWYTNRVRDRTIESRIKRIVAKFCIEVAPSFVDQKGSATHREVSHAVLLNEITSVLKNSKSLKVDKIQGDKVKLNKGKTAASSITKDSPLKVTQVKGKPAPIPKLRSAQVRETPESKINLRTLIPRFNALLPPTVKKNMVFPALRNRTGRFAQSTRIVDITQTPKGFPSVAYTYQKFPYQVFEPGRGRLPWADEDRDPRKLIEASIREIAAGIMDQRFYMRRV